MKFSEVIFFMATIPFYIPGPPWKITMFQKYLEQTYSCAQTSVGSRDDMTKVKELLNQNW